jgi:hypothetical protein
MFQPFSLDEAIYINDYNEPVLARWVLALPIAAHPLKPIM